MRHAVSREEFAARTSSRVGVAVDGHLAIVTPLTVNARALSQRRVQEQYGVVERPVEEDAMNDNEALPLAGSERRVPRKKHTLEGVLAGLAVIAWALISALSAEA